MNTHNGDTEQDKAFLSEVKLSLDRQREAIDRSTQDALRHIRQQALAQQHAPRSHAWINWPVLPALATTATAVVVVSIALTLGTPSRFDVQPDLEDILLITSTEDFMFYEDLEFYQWLEAEKING